MEFVKLRRLQFVQDYSPHSNRHLYDMYITSNIGCIRLGNPDVDFEIRISPPRNPSSGWISIKKSKSGFHGFPFYRSIGKSKKKICNTILVNSSLLFADYVCARNPSSGWISITDFMDFLFTVWLGNPNKDLQNYSHEQHSSFCWLSMRMQDGCS